MHARCHSQKRVTKNVNPEISKKTLNNELVDPSETSQKRTT